MFVRFFSLSKQNYIVVFHVWDCTVRLHYNSTLYLFILLAHGDYWVCILAVRTLLKHKPFISLKTWSFNGDFEANSALKFSTQNAGIKINIEFASDIKTLLSGLLGEQGVLEVCYRNKFKSDSLHAYANVIYSSCLCSFSLSLKKNNGNFLTRSKQYIIMYTCSRLIFNWNFCYAFMLS
jgi:hypothetical protein